MNLGDTQDTIKSFKANMSPTQKMNIRVKYYHTGSWGPSSISKPKENENPNISDSEGEEDYAWSCCLSSSKDSVGCCHRTFDGNRMNLSSFNL